MKVCEWCGKEIDKPGRFCNRSCSAKWRIKTFGVFPASEEGRKRQSESMKNNWKNPKFRKQNYERMTNNNPVYQKGVVEKANNTKLAKGFAYQNNYRYGNGKISVYEQIANDILCDYGFVYNKAIPTKWMRKKYPERHYPNNYKPDFLHEQKKICIEIDGHNHRTTYQKQLDSKKDECLRELGYTVIRFSHEDINNNRLWEWLKEWRD